jgi:predicted dehydrogenase
MRTIGVGVIGVGWMGEKHARICLELPQAKLVGVADTNRERARKVGESLKTSYYENYEELLQRPDLEAVIIATPPEHHLAPAVAAAKRGKFILLEKPMAIALQDGKEIQKAVEKAGVKLMMGFTMRFEANYVKIKQAIESGRIGEIISTYGRRNGIVSEAERMHGTIPILYWLGIHEIDASLWFTQDKVSTVYAQAVQKDIYRRFEVPDCTWVMMKYAGGALGVVECGWALPNRWAQWEQPSDWPPMAGDIQASVIGTKGIAHCSLVPTSTYMVDTEGWKFPMVDYAGTPYYGKTRGAWKEEISYFLDCVSSNREPLVNEKDGVASLEVAVAAMQSIETGKSVALPLE